MKLRIEVGEGLGVTWLWLAVEVQRRQRQRGGRVGVVLAFEPKRRDGPLAQQLGRLEGQRARGACRAAGCSGRASSSSLRLRSARARARARAWRSAGSGRGPSPRTRPPLGGGAASKRARARTGLAPRSRASRRRTRCGRRQVGRDGDVRRDHEEEAVPANTSARHQRFEPAAAAAGDRCGPHHWRGGRFEGAGSSRGGALEASHAGAVVGLHTLAAAEGAEVARGYVERQDEDQRVSRRYFRIELRHRSERWPLVGETCVLPHARSNGSAQARSPRARRRRPVAPARGPAGRSRPTRGGPATAQRRVAAAWVSQILAETDAVADVDGAVRLELTLQTDRTLLVRGRIELRLPGPVRALPRARPGRRWRRDRRAVRDLRPR